MSIIVNREDWVGSPANIKGTNKDTKIYVEKSTTVHNLLFSPHTQCMSYVTNTFLWLVPQFGANNYCVLCRVKAKNRSSEKRTVFRERSSRKTVSYEEQIMSKDKYLSIFSPQMATIVFIILQIFFATREVLKIGEYSRIFPSFIWGIFAHVTRLGQSRVSKKI